MRIEGYHWLKMPPNIFSFQTVFTSPWIIGFWNPREYPNGRWIVPRLPGTYSDEMFEVIDETPIIRDKQQ